MGLVYSITNLCTGLVYVGLTQRSGEERYAEHCSPLYYSNEALYSDMQLYGLFRFKFDVLVDGVVDARELARLEKFWIKKLESYKPGKGYNRSLGGEVNRFYQVSRSQRESLLEEEFRGQQLQEAREYFEKLLKEILDNADSWYAQGEWALTGQEQQKLRSLRKAARVGLAEEQLNSALDFLHKIEPVFEYRWKRKDVIALRAPFGSRSHLVEVVPPRERVPPPLTGTLAGQIVVVRPNGEKVKV